MDETAVILTGDAILAAGLGLVLLLEVRHHVNHPRGQALVELALALPILLFMALGAFEAGSLLIAKADEDHNVRVVAEWAAAHPSEAPGAVMHAVGLDSCAVTITPDDDLGIVHVGATCPYVPRITSNIWSGLQVSAEAAAAYPVGAVLGIDGTPEPSGP